MHMHCHQSYQSSSTPALLTSSLLLLSCFLAFVSLSYCSFLWLCCSYKESSSIATKMRSMPCIPALFRFVLLFLHALFQPCFLCHARQSAFQSTDQVVCGLRHFSVCNLQHTTRRHAAIRVVNIKPEHPVRDISLNHTILSGSSSGFDSLIIFVAYLWTSQEKNIQIGEHRMLATKRTNLTWNIVPLPLLFCRVIIVCTNPHRSPFLITQPGHDSSQDLNWSKVFSVMMSESTKSIVKSVLHRSSTKHMGDRGREFKYTYGNNNAFSTKKIQLNFKYNSNITAQRSAVS